MRGIHSTLVVLLIVCACSAEAEGPPEEPEAADPVDIIVPLPSATQRPPTPLCEGEDEPLPGECQRLVYIPASGYCNRWFTCER